MSVHASVASLGNDDRFKDDADRFVNIDASKKSNRGGVFGGVICVKGTGGALQCGPGA